MTDCTIRWNKVGSIAASLFCRLHKGTVVEEQPERDGEMNNGLFNCRRCPSRKQIQESASSTVRSMSAMAISRQLTGPGGSIDGMFPVPWFVIALYLAAYALAGMGIGAITGWLVSLLTKRGREGLLKDALLGSFGYLAGFFVCIFMPWPQNTVVSQIEGGGSVATTLSRYQHPELVAIVIAVFFPLLYELSRWKKRKTSSLA
jgi:uncharacterized membrane protein YeaQ/YmgE (transglycosylase-associated protein family)